MEILEQSYFDCLFSVSSASFVALAMCPCDSHLAKAVPYTSERSMIIARMDGGLGNQMFQYAYGLHLARMHQTELILDTSSYASAPQHGFLLDRFCIEAQLATRAHQPRIPPRYRDTAESATGESQSDTPPSPSLADRFGWRALRRLKESPFGFHTKYLSATDNRYLVGYWQSEKFFPGLRRELVQHFQLRDELGDKSQAVARRIESTNSVVLHIRRGDYVNSSSAAAIYEHLDLSYYVDCVQDWAASQRDLEVFVFSNDMGWCRDNIRLPWVTHWIDHNDASTAHEDLALMSRAACCIIANSTFSWWAAWLNERASKTVYAPSRWFRPGTHDGRHVICDSWKQMDLRVGRQAA